MEPEHSTRDISSLEFPSINRARPSSRRDSQAGPCFIKAIAVQPGTPDSIFLAELDKPSVGDIPDGRGVLVRLLKVGVDATDREINETLCGQPRTDTTSRSLAMSAWGLCKKQWRLTYPRKWYHSLSGDLIAVTDHENSLWSGWPVAL